MPSGHFEMCPFHVENNLPMIINNRRVVRSSPEIIVYDQHHFVSIEPCDLKIEIVIVRHLSLLSQTHACRIVHRQYNCFTEINFIVSRKERKRERERRVWSSVLFFSLSLSLSSNKDQCEEKKRRKTNDDYCSNIIS